MNDSKIGRTGKTWPVLLVTDRIKFPSEKMAYTVRAVSADGRFVICTKPFNPRRTVLYTVIDFYRGVRGRDDHYGLGYETPEQIALAMYRFQSGDAEVSHKTANHITLHIEWVNKVDPEYDHFTAPVWEDRKRWQALHDAEMAARAVSD